MSAIIPPNRAGNPRSPSVPVSRADLYRAFIASLSGTSLEWYDFAVYSAASALVLGALFFPAQDPYAATIAAFSTYAVGYLSRPVGGIIFGRLGDIIGRKRVLVLTLLLIGTTTFLVGLLPTYHSIGISAAVLLVLLRFAQGVGIGGEWGGAVLLSSEFGDPRRRGFWASAAQVGPPAGNLLANGVLVVLTSSMSSEAFLAFGWRIAFLLSAVLVLFGLWIRLKLEDTPIFHELQARGTRSSRPVMEVLTTARKALLSALLARLGPDVFYALFTVFLLSYGVNHWQMSRSEVLAGVLIGSATQLVTIPLAGWLSDVVNRRLLYAVAVVAAGLTSFLIFAVVRPHDFGTLVLCMIIAGTCHSFMYGPQAAFVIEQFPAAVRSTGASLAYTFAGIFGGALAPLLFTLLSGPQAHSLPVSLYVCVACALSLLGLALGKDPKAQEHSSTGQ